MRHRFLAAVSDDPVSRNLLQAVSDRVVAATPFADLAPLPLEGEGQKWLASSSIQKAIRRGNERTAVQMAMTLQALDAEYLWRRLPTIAFEDVGLSDVQVIAQIALLSKHKTLREQVGSSNATRFAARELARSAKDRTLVDLLVTAEYHPSAKAERRSLASVSLHTLQEIVRGENTPLLRRIVALRRLAGCPRRLNLDQGCRLNSDQAL